MKIINLLLNENIGYLEEYATICKLTWGEMLNNKNLKEYVKNKVKSILNEDKVISVLGLTYDNKLIGFISLFKSDGEKMLVNSMVCYYVRKRRI